MGAVPIQLADAFGLVVQCRDMVGDHAVLAQTVHTLQQAVQPGKSLYSSCWEFSTQDYKEVNKTCFSSPNLILGVYSLTVKCNNFLLYSWSLMQEVCKWSSALEQRN